MKKNRRLFSGIIVFSLALTALAVRPVHAQLVEPPVKKMDSIKTPLTQGYHNGLDLNIVINNFGFGVGGQYSRVLGPLTQLTFNAGITGIRDVSEQSFQDFFTGQRIVPNKYNRALAFPVMVGVKHRLFARAIEDNFRFFVSSSAGPVLAFLYPYINDSNENGYRDYAVNQAGFLVPVERINDFFTGWKDGHTHWGAAGEVKIGVDLGSNFKHQTTFEFGYLFYYFNQGLQMMEPKRPVYDNNGNVQNVQHFFDAQKFFGTPQISIKFGGFW